MYIQSIYVAEVRRNTGCEERSPASSFLKRAVFAGEAGERLAMIDSATPTVTNADRHLRFGEYILDVNRRLLLSGSVAKPLSEKLFQMLMVLLRANGEIVPKEQFFRAIWPEGAVSDGNLSQHVLMLRQLLGDQDREHPYIVTASGKGYRLAASVEQKCGLVMRRLCERCITPLRSDDRAFICSYECTFCPACASELASCPNCGGELVARPRRAV